jgi:hypothetical protein
MLGGPAWGLERLLEREDEDQGWLDGLNYGGPVREAERMLELLHEEEDLEESYSCVLSHDH